MRFPAALPCYYALCRPKPRGPLLSSGTRLCDPRDLPANGGGSLSRSLTPACECLPAQEDRASADAVCGTAVSERGEAVRRELQLSNGKPGEQAKSDRQDRMAPGQADPACGFKRHELAHGAGLGPALLQSAQHSQTAYQGRQTRHPLNATDLRAAPRQYNAAATASAGLELGQLAALGRSARRDGRLVALQPSPQADRERITHCAPRQRYHLQPGRSGRDRSEGAHQTCRHPPAESATAISVAGIPTQTERKRHEKPARSADKRCRQDTMTRARSLLAKSEARSRSQTPLGAKSTINQQVQATLAVKPQAT